jgi:hypothetical protein
MQERAEEKRYPFPYCHDASQEVAKSFGALCTPHCFVGVYPGRDAARSSRGDRHRILQYKGRIDDNWKDPSQVKERNLSEAIQALLQGKTPRVQAANAIGCSIKWKPSLHLGV